MGRYPASIADEQAQIGGGHHQVAGEGHEIAEEPGEITGETVLNGAELLQIASGM